MSTKAAKTALVKVSLRKKKKNKTEPCRISFTAKLGERLLEMGKVTRQLFTGSQCNVQLTLTWSEPWLYSTHHFSLFGLYLVWWVYSEKAFLMQSASFTWSCKVLLQSDLEKWLQLIELFLSTKTFLFFLVTLFYSGWVNLMSKVTISSLCLSFFYAFHLAAG